MARIDPETSPERYRHWRLDVDGRVATLTLAVTPGAGLRHDYELKLNSYDLAVDIELRDAVERLRFEHPEVAAVVVTGGLDKVFCAGANIQMLAGSSHAHKVNFCKFTNETRNAIEDATWSSGQAWIAAVNGTAAGGGYELALACDEILMVDDRASAVSLPEVPLLAVLPGTGGLTRLVDKRHVRRDLADVFATRPEGVKAPQALAWGLVDATAPRSRFDGLVAERAAARVAASDRPAAGPGISLGPLGRVDDSDGGGDSDGLGGGGGGGGSATYRWVTVRIDRALGAATIEVRAPEGPEPADPGQLLAAGDTSWLVAAARQLDDAVLRLRFDQPAVGTWVLTSRGDPAAVLDAEAVLGAHPDHWLAREVRLLWGRVLRRLDLSARTLVALVDPGSAAAGLLAELVLAADRSYHLDASAADDVVAPHLRLSEANDGWVPMANGLSRLASRCWGRDDDLAAARALIGKDLLAADALAAGLVTATPDDLDWDDEVRLVLEERASFSPDALTGLEANLRWVGPETLHTKVFGRLTAWQNWIFSRPNAVGPEGALRRYGTGSRPSFDHDRT